MFIVYEWICIVCSNRYQTIWYHYLVWYQQHRIVPKYIGLSSRSSICSNDIDILCVPVASSLCSSQVGPAAALRPGSGQRGPHHSWLPRVIQGSELRLVWRPQTQAQLSVDSCWGSEGRNCLQLTAERRGPWDLGTWGFAVLLIQGSHISYIRERSRHWINQLWKKT